MTANIVIKPLRELISKESAWPKIKKLAKNSKNKIEILPKDSKISEISLFRAQVTTKSAMGAIIYETGGILINDGLIRILGSGSKKLNRNLPEWNLGKTTNSFQEYPSYLLVADDAVGGFFAINGGGLSTNNIGDVFYLSPDNLQWECLNVSYSRFITFCLTGDIDKFYQGLQWTNWKEDLKSVGADQAMSFYPFLFTKEGKNLDKVSKKPVPIEEIWKLYRTYQ